jgi:serine/threonine protein kinase
MSVTGAHRAALRDLLPGQVLCGTQGARYFIRERIGEGGQGWVFSASWNEPDGYRVVVKVLRPDVVTAESLSRFEREASVLRMPGASGRPNPYVIRYFDHAKDAIKDPASGEPIEVTFTVLEHVAGPTLERVLSESRGMSLPLERVRRIGSQVVQALSDVHGANIVHRDLKPSNVLLATEGGVETAKVTDFGLVKVQSLGFARTTALAGATLGYAPPEQFERGNERVSPRTDVFSFAAMLYEMLCGAPAFPYSEGESPLLIVTRLLNGPRPSLARAAAAAAAGTRGRLAPELKDRPDLVERVDAVLAQATAAEPTERQATIADMWTAMERVLRTATERASSPPPAGHRPTPGPMSAAALAAQQAMSPEALEALMRTTPEESKRGDPAADARLASPSAWYWRIRQPAVTPGVATSAVLDPAGEGAYACGSNGLMRWQSQGWRPVAKSFRDVGLVRGLARLGPDDVLAFGARGLVARVGPEGNVDAWTVPERDATFHAAHVDDAGIVTLVGERPLRPAERQGGHEGSIAIIAQFQRGKLMLVSEAAGCAGLRGVTRVASGAIVACGNTGSLVRLELGVAQHLGSICAGHLLAIVPLLGGGAVTVGAGGHALSLSPALAPQLEAVQTTRHLLSLCVDPGGVAWAGSAQARLLRRSNGSWVRMSGELGLSSAVVSLTASPTAVRAVCDDGAIVEGAVLAG